MQIVNDFDREPRPGDTVADGSLEPVLGWHRLSVYVEFRDSSCGITRLIRVLLSFEALTAPSHARFRRFRCMKGFLIRRTSAHSITNKTIDSTARRYHH